MTKVVLITGSSGGVGDSLVRTFLARGYTVFGLDKEVTSTAARSRENCFFEFKCDLNRYSTNEPYRQEIVALIKDKIPKDIGFFSIIHAAAIQILHNINEFSPEIWQSSMNVNVLSFLLLVRDFQHELVKLGGSVLAISSIHAHLTKQGFTSYAATKAALSSIVNSLALELSPIGVAVNCIAPAAIDTKMLRDGFGGDDKFVDELASYHPAQRLGDPSRLANFVFFVVNEPDHFFTGSVIDYSGGISGRLYDPN